MKLFVKSKTNCSQMKLTLEWLFSVYCALFSVSPQVISHYRYPIFFLFTKRIMYHKRLNRNLSLNLNYCFCGDMKQLQILRLLLIQGSRKVRIIKELDGSLVELFSEVVVIWTETFGSKSPDAFITNFSDYRSDYTRDSPFTTSNTV